VILAHDMAFHLDAYQLLNDQKLRQLAKPILEDKLHGGTKRDRSDKKESERRRAWNWDRGCKKF
jgi:hypothetical protein